MKSRAQRIHHFLWAYSIAVLVCWGTQAVFFRISGHRGSLLAFVMLGLEEFLRVSLNHMFGREVISYLPAAYAVSVIVAAILAALPLATAFTLTEAENRGVRWMGYLALTVLAFMVLYWPLIPNSIF